MPDTTITTLTLTASEVSELVNVPETTVLNSYRIGSLIGRKFGKHLRFLRDDVAAWVASVPPARD